MADSDSSTPILRYNLITQNVEYFLGADYYPIAVPTGDISLPSGQLLVGNSTGQAVARALSGAGTLSNTGVLSLTLAHLNTLAGNASGVAIANSVLQVDITNTAVGINTVPVSGNDLTTNGNLQIGGSADVIGTVYGGNFLLQTGGQIGAHNGATCNFQNTFTNTQGFTWNSPTPTVIMSIDTTNDAVAVGPSAANTSAVLDVQSTTKGLLPPRMTTTQKDAITSPPESLMVYDLTLHGPSFYNGSAWFTITATGIVNS